MNTTKSFSKKRANFNRNNNNKNRNVIRISESSGIPNPPQWSPTVKFNYIQRFFCAPGGGVNLRPITNLDLLDLKFVATGAAAGNRIFGGVKLNSLDVWCANTSATASNTVLVEWFTNNPSLGSSSKIFSDTAVGTTNVAHVHAKPPPGSFSADWLPNVIGTNYSIFNITCPQGSIVDVNMTVELIDDETTNTLISGTIAAATAGVLYTRALDSVAGTAGFTPLGVNFI